MIKLREYQQNAINESLDSLKKDDKPVLLECSVGGGKSYIIASIAKKLDDLNKRVLCLVNSSELVRNNSSAFKDFNGNPSIFCSSLLEKTHDKNVVFATPQSVISALKSNHPISDIVFNLIIVDEAHAISFFSDSSIFMRILRHYKQSYKSMRVLGLTGTPFRGDMSIVGEEAFFKTKVGNISTQYLIENGFLVPPIFGHKKVDSFDFSKCKANNMGEFNASDLQEVIDKNKRLTWKILQEVQEIMKDRNSAMIFCSTKAHCYEALDALPQGTARIILGDTPSDVRNESLNLTREGKIKWLISVNCLLTGVNITALNGIVWLRPTSSLLLFIQGIGRGLRLHDGKTDCLVLDYASNLTRFSDIDDPIINEALKPREGEDEKERPFKCYTCSTYNLVTARRCCGMVDGKRCNHFFEFKNCPQCGVPNDITSRQCRICSAELINPNDKLTPNQSETYSLNVISAFYKVEPYGSTSLPVIKIYYNCGDYRVFESYHSSSWQSCNILYNKFLKIHVDKPSRFYKKITNLYCMRQLITSGEIKTPSILICKNNQYGQLQITKKIFI